MILYSLKLSQKFTSSQTTVFISAYSGNKSGWWVSRQATCPLMCNLSKKAYLIKYLRTIGGGSFVCKNVSKLIPVDTYWDRFGQKNIKTFLFLIKCLFANKVLHTLGNYYDLNNFYQ